MDRKPPGEMRRFALGALVFFTLWSTVLFLKGHGRWAIGGWAAAAIIAVAGLRAPVLLTPLHRAAAAVAGAIGWLVTRLILSLLYYGVVTPISFVLKSSGWDALGLRRGSAKSYWITRSAVSRLPADYEKQF